MKGRALVVIALLATAAAPGVAPAAEPDAGTLATAGRTVRWDGRFYTTSDAPVPDRFALTVDLPDGFWDHHDGGVEVAIRWESEYNVFDLYVFDDGGELLASSTGFPSSAQAVVIPELANGLYDVVVVPSAIQVDSGYEGIAQVEPAPNPQPLRDLLPNLAPEPPNDFHVASGTYSFTPAENTDESCYPEERLEDGAERCLRFAASIANVGEGPFELLFDLTSFALDQRVVQEIARSDGSHRLHDAGTYTFHPTHGHVHYQSFAVYALHAVDDRGRRGAEVVRSRKSDFCMIDTRLVRFGERGNQGRRHGFPQCDAPSLATGEPTTMRQGISAGWADVYAWDLPGQYLDITGVPDGTYDVVIIANPFGALAEATAADNEAATRICLAGNAVTLGACSA